MVCFFSKCSVTFFQALICTVCMYCVCRSETVTYISLSLLASLEADILCACVTDKWVRKGCYFIPALNAILLSLPSSSSPTPPLTVPALFAAAALLTALLAAAQPQRAPPGSGRAPHPTDRCVQAVRRQGPAQEESDLQLLLHCLHHHRWWLPTTGCDLQNRRFRRG